MIVAVVSALALKCTPFELWRPIQICWVHLNPWNWGMKHEDEVNCGNTNFKWGSTHGTILITNYNHWTEPGNVTLVFLHKPFFTVLSSMAYSLFLHVLPCKSLVHHFANVQPSKTKLVVVPFTCAVGLPSLIQRTCHLWWLYDDVLHVTPG